MKITMSETIRILKDRMRWVSSEIETLLAEKKEIQAALDAIDGIKNCENPEPNPRDSEKKKLSDVILKILQEFNHPMSKKEIFQVFRDIGIETTLGSVSATLTRMKSNGHIINEREKWQAVPPSIAPANLINF
jgi:hypothetical protein